MMSAPFSGVGLEFMNIPLLLRKFISPTIILRYMQFKKCEKKLIHCSVQCMSKPSGQYQGIKNTIINSELVNFLNRDELIDYKCLTEI